MNNENLKNKKILVVGMGKSGIAATRAMVQLGAEVTVQDGKTEDQIDGQLLNYLEGRNVKCYFGELPDVADYDMIILSPGVDPDLEFVRREHLQGAEITGELEIAYRLAKGTFVAITGTNGKTTTTTLVGEIFRKSGRKTHVAGNIGIAVITEAMESDEDDWLITETSSFQLQTIRYFKPAVSAILNLTPDHLNRHHTMENYGYCKSRIWENQDSSGYLVINSDDPVCMDLCLERVGTPKAKIIPFSRRKELEMGAFLKDGMLVLKNEKGELIEFCNKDELKIIGDHNIENALAAIAICYFSGIDKDVIADVIRTFGGVEHRIEYCGACDGVRFYNDSKGTNVDAAIIAIKAIKENIILIAGGDSKKQEFDELAAELKGKVKHVMLLGRDRGDIIKALDKQGYSDYTLCKNMDECVAKAFEIAENGDTVLLSPACASWDMYDNFEQRGNHFKDCVAHLGAV